MSEKNNKNLRRKIRRNSNDLVLEFFKGLKDVDFKTRLKVAIKILFHKNAGTK